MLLLIIAWASITAAKDDPLAPVYAENQVLGLAPEYAGALVAYHPGALSVLALVAPGSRTFEPLLMVESRGTFAVTHAGPERLRVTFVAEGQCDAMVADVRLSARIRANASMRRSSRATTGRKLTLSVHEFVNQELPRFARYWGAETGTSAGVNIEAVPDYCHVSDARADDHNAGVVPVGFSPSGQAMHLGYARQRLVLSAEDVNILDVSPATVLQVTMAARGRQLLALTTSNGEYITVHAQAATLAESLAAQLGRGDRAYRLLDYHAEQALVTIGDKVYRVSGHGEPELIEGSSPWLGESINYPVALDTNPLGAQEYRAFLALGGRPEKCEWQRRSLQQGFYETQLGCSGMTARWKHRLYDESDLDRWRRLSAMARFTRSDARHD